MWRIRLDNEYNNVTWHCYFRNYFPLPKELRNQKKELIDIQNDDNECFSWWLVIYIYIYPVNKKPAKIRSVEKKFIRKFDFKAVKCPVHKKDYPKVEKQNNISVNVFGYEDETSYHIYTSKQTFGNMLMHCYHQILKMIIMF